MTMNKFRLLYPALASVGLLACLLGSCQKEAEAFETPRQSAENKLTNDEEIPWIAGEAYIKLTQEGLRSIDTLGTSLRSSSLRSFSSGLKLEPIFDISGEYAPAMIREGLHRWYRVTFDKSAKVQEVIDDLDALDAVEFVHGGLEIERQEVSYTPLRSGRRNFPPDYNEGYPQFTTPDPLLRKQWHYQISGTRVYRYEPGSDIGLFGAWPVTTGTPNVIVAIIDSGIDTSHPDLQGSMWTSSEGHHGWNFYNDTSNIDAGFHGTHVGGTVGARSNNGKGIAGVAGGDGSDNSGVRLMSCQIFGPDDRNGNAKVANTGQIAKSFTYAANNGAVIANCSWGYPYIKSEHGNAARYKELYANATKVLSEAINYFVKYAGNDASGKQKPGSPMSGGIVLFASGNDSTRDVEISPAADPAVISVGAIGPEYNVTSYTNIGTWVDILAPGGDITFDDVSRGVLSTVPIRFKDIFLNGEPASKFIYPNQDFEERDYYAYANGTSMATPHVSGIAALMVSHFGKNPGFTNTKLQERLMGAIKARNLYQDNPDLALRGKIGVGYIDASLALREPETQAPEAAQGLNAKEVNYYDATIAWNISADSDAPNDLGSAFAYDIYLSTEEIKTPTGEPTAVGYSHNASVGSELTHRFEELESNTKYYVALVARDRSANKSAAVYTSFTTLENNVPKITNKPEEKVVILETTPYYTYSFKVEDADKHTWTYKVGDLPRGVSLIREGDYLKLTVQVNDNLGTYAIDVLLTDEIQGKNTEKLEYQIVPHQAPSLNKPLHDLYLALGDKPMRIALADLYQVAVGKKLSLLASSSNEAVATATVEGAELIISPVAKGVASIKLVASDESKKSQSSLLVHVTEQSLSPVYAHYPSPAHSYLKILMRQSVPSIEVIVSSMRGQVLIENTLEVSADRREATLSVDRLAPGVYNLIIKSGGTTSKRTFIKN